ncbi:MAG: lytic transglycosylase domain-containing protein, partial [Nocardioidaceae bacterium]
MATRHKAIRGAPRWQRATAVLPMALLAAAWTASLNTASVAVADSNPVDPGVPSVPATALDQPASYTTPPALDPNDLHSNPRQSTSPGGRTPSSSALANGIPSAAMSAYKRAEAVLDRADPSCHLSWALIAAIGRVESDHGRYGGNILNDSGESVPGIYGIPLDGRDGSALIRDTDNGRYDDDPVYDRAVGAMQFIPSTWQIVGVDGDNDGVADPQDIYDSAIAAGVYLCAGSENLSTAAGQSTAIYRYNHSEKYVSLVVSIMHAYLDGDYRTVADGLPSNQFVPSRHTVSTDTHPRKHQNKTHPRTAEPTENAPTTQAPINDDTTPSPRTDQQTQDSDEGPDKDKSPASPDPTTSDPGKVVQKA